MAAIRESRAFDCLLKMKADPEGRDPAADESDGSEMSDPPLRRLMGLDDSANWLCIDWAPSRKSFKSGQQTGSTDLRKTMSQGHVGHVTKTLEEAPTRQWERGG